MSEDTQHKYSMNRLVSNQMDSHFFDMEDEIIRRAIGTYMRGDLDPMKAMAFVGELAAVRRLQERLEADARRSSIHVAEEIKDG